MLTPFTELLAGSARGSAVGAFTCYDLESAVAALGAASAAGAGVILQIGGGTHAEHGGDLLLAALLAAAGRAEARACVSSITPTSWPRSRRPSRPAPAP